MHDTKLGKEFSLKDFITLALAFGLFFIAGTIHQNNPKPKLVLTKQDTAFNLNRNILLFLNLGNKRLFADLLWVQTLLESDEEHYAKKDLNSWMYLRFLTIASLDPLFYENYAWGGLYLSIVKDDLIGASVIYEKGLTYYPDDFKLNYYVGFNYYFEQGDFKKGLHYLSKVKNHPEAPRFIKMLINKLTFETTKNHDVALSFLRFEYDKAKDPTLKRKLVADIYALQADRDIECLTSGKKDCSLKDAEGNPYLFSKGKWISAKPYKKYQIFRTKK
jgi:hypothetical protein